MSNDDDLFWSTSKEQIRLVFGIVAVLFYPTVLVCILQFARRRHIHPIRGRKPELVLLGDAVIIAYFSAITAYIFIMPEYDCTLYSWQRLLGNALICTVYIVRCIYLAFKFNLSVELSRSYRESQMVRLTTFTSTNTRERAGSLSQSFSNPNVPHASMTNSSNAGGKSVSVDETKNEYQDAKQEDVEVHVLGDDSGNNDVEQEPEDENKEPPVLDIRVASNSATNLDPTAVSSHRFSITPLKATTEHEWNDLGYFEGWYTQHRWWISSWGLVCLLLAFGTLFVAPGGVMLFFVSVENVRGDCTAGIADDYAIGVIIFAALIFIYLTYHMKEVVEGFYVTRELKATGVSAILLSVIFIAVREVEDNYFPFSQFVALFVLVVIFGLSTIYPLYLTRQTPEADDVNTLDGVLRHSKGREAFHRHLAREFAVENLLFVEAVRDFRRMVRRERLKSFQKFGANKQGTRTFSLSAPKKAPPDYQVDADTNNYMWTKAVALYKQFIASNAPFSINLPYDLYQKIKQCIGMVNNQSEPTRTYRNIFGSPDVDSTPASRQNSGGRNSLVITTVAFDVSMWDEAYESIYNLLLKDNFPRFSSTVEYKALRSEQKQMENIRHHFTAD